jgi:DNA-binding transcriptional ArsR family regulator
MSRDIDFERLSSYLKALAHPARLEILYRLRIPATPGDIVVRPRRRDEGLSQERPMSRQSLMEHIEQLEAVGVVDRVPGASNDFVTSPQHVFAIVEDMRKLSAIEPAMQVDVDATFAGVADARPSWPAGPRLVLVSGPWEGRAFALAGAGPWTVGRATGQSIALTYDPYASGECARVVREGGAVRLEPIAGARNPPQVNFTPVAAARALRPGDVVGVGRSLLVYQEG